MTDRVLTGAEAKWTVNVRIVVYGTCGVHDGLVYSIGLD